MIIRPVQPDERPAVGDLRVTAYAAVGGLDEAGDYAETLRTFGFADDCMVLVAVDDPTPSSPNGSGVLGTVTVKPFGPDSELAQDKAEADIRAFAVDPRAQGRGVGRALLRAVIDDARERGLRTLRLCTQPQMTTAQRVYEGAGFTRTPDRDFSPVPGLLLRAYELPLGGGR